jgi:hypothetical protein
MDLSLREQPLLDKIRKAVGWSDCRLASMLGIFRLLTAGEEVPDRKQLHTSAGRVGAVEYPGGSYFRSCSQGEPSVNSDHRAGHRAAVLPR